MNNKFLNSNIYSLFNYLLYKEIQENEIEDFLTAFYDAYCKAKNYLPAKLSFESEKDIFYTEKGLTCYGCYIAEKKEICLNKSALKDTLMSPISFDRMLTLVTIIHENRHHLQNINKEGDNDEIDYASACNKVFSAHINMMAAVEKYFMETAMHKQKEQNYFEMISLLALWQEQQQSIVDTLTRGYAFFPWELDARDYTLQEIEDISEIYKPVGLLHNILIKNSEKLRKKYPDGFSMLDFIETCEQFMKTHEDVLKDSQEISIFNEYKNIIFDIYEQNDVKTKDQESDFIKKLYSNEFISCQSFENDERDTD